MAARASTSRHSARLNALRADIANASKVQYIRISAIILMIDDNEELTGCAVNDAYVVS